MPKEEKDMCTDCCSECPEREECTKNEDNSDAERIDLLLAELFYALMNKDKETIDKITQDLDLPKETIKEMQDEIEKNPDVYTTIGILEALGFTIVAERNDIQIPLDFSGEETALEEDQEK